VAISQREKRGKLMDNRCNEGIRIRLRSSGTCGAISQILMQRSMRRFYYLFPRKKQRKEEEKSTAPAHVGDTRGRAIR
jgi:hypothetical protein